MGLCAEDALAEKGDPRVVREARDFHHTPDEVYGARGRLDAGATLVLIGDVREEIEVEVVILHLGEDDVRGGREVVVERQEDVKAV